MQVDDYCCVLYHKDVYDEYECYIEHHRWNLSCGHTVLTESEEAEPKYCTECGHEVIPREELLSKMRNGINDHRHKITCMSIVKTEQVSHIAFVSEEIIGYEFKAYCAKCGLNENNVYGSEIEAMKALYDMSNDTVCK